MSDSFVSQALPKQFSDLQPFVADWALPTRAQRYEARLSKPFDELVTFYDGVAPRAEEAVAYCQREGIAYQLFAPKPTSAPPKSYSDNFRFDRKIPWSH